MPRITPFLWFDDQAEEAMNYYVSIFNEQDRRGRPEEGLRERVGEDKQCDS